MNNAVGLNVKLFNGQSYFVAQENKDIGDDDGDEEENKN